MTEQVIFPLASPQFPLPPKSPQTVCPWRVFVGVLRGFVVSSRDFHLAHRALVATVESWVAVEPNGTGLPSTPSPPRLGALLPSPKRGLPVGILSLEGFINTPQL